MSGLALAATSLTLTDDDQPSTTVALTLSPDTVSENGGNRTVTVTGTLDGGASGADTAIAITVGANADSAVEGTDYEDVPELTLTVPANQTDGTVSFTLQPVNDVTAEGTETVSVSGTVTSATGLSVIPNTLTLTDDDAPSTRLDLTLNPSRYRKGRRPPRWRSPGRSTPGRSRRTRW